MAKRMYLATKGMNTVVVELDLTTRKATGVRITTVNTETKLSEIESLLQVMNSIEFDKEKEPVQFFVNDYLEKTIRNGYYKFWLISKARGTTGEVVSDEEIALWEELHNMITENALKVIIKSSKEHRLNKSLLDMEGKYSKKIGKKVEISASQKHNDKYIAYCWNEVKKLSQEDVIEEVDMN